MEVQIEISGVLDGIGERRTPDGNLDRVPLHELPMIAFYADQLASCEVEKDKPHRSSSQEIITWARAVLDFDWYNACDYLNIPLIEWNLVTEFEQIPDDLKSQLTSKAHLGMIISHAGAEHVLIAATLKDGSLYKPLDGIHYHLSLAAKEYFLVNSQERLHLLEILDYLRDDA
jgi:hypothetical protein